MWVIWSICWGVLILIIMLATIKYYLPKLSLRVNQSTFEAQAVTLEKDKVPDDTEQSCEIESSEEIDEDALNNYGFIQRNRFVMICILFCCTLFAAFCGYTAAAHSNSLLGMLKMTLAFGVLGCVFITDLKLMIIPNMCSVVLLAGRLFTIIAEFIWVREEALSWLINSIIAMFISLLLLLIMSKVTRGGIGLGDVKIFAGIGFLCGIRAVYSTLVLAFLACAIISTLFLLTKKKRMKDSLPLGPFIWIGYGIAVLLSII